MSQTIKQEVLGTTKQGQEVLLFRIPNNTNDYIEVTNYGCAICGIYVHNNQGKLENTVWGGTSLAEYEACNPGTIFAGPLGRALAHKVWDVADVGDNYVFLASQCDAGESGCSSAVKVGARIMWVNLNRLVIDLFLTPGQGTQLTFGTQLLVDADKHAPLQVRSFCPQVSVAGAAPIPTEESPYAAMVFSDAAGMKDTFLSTSEEIKPMAELAVPGEGLFLSAYTTLSALRLETCDQPKAVRLVQETDQPVPLGGGVSFTARAIYGVDYLRPQPASEEEEVDINPMSVFFAGE